MDITLLEKVVAAAIRQGATEAEVMALESTEFVVEVRLGEIETLQESASRGIGLRVIHEGRQASASTSNLQPEALDRLVAEAVEMARHTSVDEAAVLPSRGDLGDCLNEDLRLYDEAIAGLPTDQKIDLAKRCEDAARSYSKLISNSEGARCATNLAQLQLLTSSGFSGSYRASRCGLMVSPIASEGDSMQVSGWGDSQRWLDRLDSPEDIGEEAARRALRKLGAHKTATQEVPIVFDSVSAAELLDNIFEAVSGESVFRRSSFLVGRLNEEIASPKLTVIDDGTIPGAVGSRPFDGEGMPSRKTHVIENGVLRSYLLNTYTARKLGLKSTGNAVRGLTGAPGVGTNNFYVQPGESTADEIIASVKNGFYVTELIGFGFNPVTGDYSRGASGIWIENGKLTSPVEEVTIAGNLRDMLRGIEMVGNDLRFRGHTASPTIKIGRMMVSGD